MVSDTTPTQPSTTVGIQMAPQSLRKLGHHPFGLVLRPIESPIDYSLYAMAERIEGRCNAQCRRCDHQRAVETGAHRGRHQGYDRAEEANDNCIRDRSRDDAIDLIEAVSGHGDSDADGGADGDRDDSNHANRLTHPGRIGQPCHLEPDHDEQAESNGNQGSRDLTTHNTIAKNQAIEKRDNRHGQIRPDYGAPIEGGEQSGAIDARYSTARYAIATERDRATVTNELQGVIRNDELSCAAEDPACSTSDCWGHPE